MSLPQFRVTIGENQFDFQENTQPIDLVRIDTNTYHALLGTRSLLVRVIARMGKVMSLEVEGKVYEVAIENAYDLLADKLGLDTTESIVETAIFSPMPGLIVELLKTPGDAFEEGDSLLILEAMKMENVIKAKSAGTIKSINVAKGDSVEKGQILIELD